MPESTNHIPIQERREKVKRYLLELGPENINNTELAKELNVERHTIQRDINFLLKHIEPDELPLIRTSILISYRKARKEIMKILATSNNPDQRLRATEKLAIVNDKYLSFLERTGLMKIMPLQIESKSVSLSIQLTDDEFRERLQRYEKDISS